MFQIWYSTEIFADYIISNTILKDYEYKKYKILESDANNSTKFHKMPDHLKKILYLDAPDLIVELNGEPLFSIEISREAGTGHNAFQRFARIVASVENNVPAFYVYPEAVMIYRKSNNSLRWDKINFNIFKALINLNKIHNIPALMFYYPSHYPSTSSNFPNKGLIDDDFFYGCPNSQSVEMNKLFETINMTIKKLSDRMYDKKMLMNENEVKDGLEFLSEQLEKHSRGDELGSPITATKIVKTKKITEYLSNFGYDKELSMLEKREYSIIYQADSKYRGDPYVGSLAAIDYILARTGETFEDRKYNLFISWGKVLENENNIEINSITETSVNDIVNIINKVDKDPKRALLGHNFDYLKKITQIPRFYMQVRYGYAYTKPKEIRGFVYFADGILFQDGALWREA